MAGEKFVEEAAKQVLEGPVKKSINSVFDSFNKGVESLDIGGKYETAQKKLITSSLQNIKLLGMTSPVPLENIYYPTHVSTSVGRRLYEQEWLSEKESESGAHQTLPKASLRRGTRNSLRGDDALEKFKKIVVLGGPGAGKTTFLRFMALAYSKSDLFSQTHLATSLLPFFVHLPKLAKEEVGLLEYLAAPLEKKVSEHSVCFVKRRFENASAIVLLDSLDEVPAAHRSDVMDKIREFEALFPSANMVISCRTADYEEVLENFTEVEVLRLSRDAITKIVNAWFVDEKDKATRLLSLIKNDEGVASLTETPLLLSLLCIQFRHDLQLPKRRVELYRRCIDALLRDWDSSRGFRRESSYENLSDDRKERLFEHVAGKFFIEQESYEFKRDETISAVGAFVAKLGINSSEAESLLDEIERHHGIIEQLSQDYFCFSHTSLQEYFVARHALSKRIELALATKNIENENWLPVIEFIVSLAEDPNEILQLLIKKSEMGGLCNFPPMGRRTKLLWLLYRCLLASPFADPALVDKCHQHLVISQIKMAKIYSSGGVFPLAVLDNFGVRHVLFYANKPRPTLATALQPYRKFANQIYAAPLDGYAKAVLKACDALVKNKEAHVGVPIETILICLLVPISSISPEQVKTRLLALIEGKRSGVVQQIVQQSLASIEQLLLKKN